VAERDSPDTWTLTYRSPRPSMIVVRTLFIKCFIIIWILISTQIIRVAFTTTSGIEPIICPICQNQRIYL
jgi:hypothetical protein